LFLDISGAGSAFFRMALALAFHGRGSSSRTALCFSAMDRMLGFRVPSPILRARAVGGLAAFNAALCSRAIYGRNLWATFMSTSRAILGPQPSAFISLTTLLIIASDCLFSTCQDRGMVRSLALDFSMKHQGCSVLSGSGRIFADPSSVEEWRHLRWASSRSPQVATGAYGMENRRCL